MEENLVKEQFSYSFVSAIASIAKFATYKPSVDDDSIDIGFSLKGGGGTISSPRLEAQLKCTSADIRKKDCLHFPLIKKNYDELRIENVHIPRILIVVLVPEKLQECVQHTEEEALILKRCGYWASLRGFPESENQNSVTIHIPRKNIFTVDSLHSIMTKVGKGLDLMKIIFSKNELMKVNPVDLISYLKAKGWMQKKSVYNSLLIWTQKKAGNGEFEVLVPLETNFVDYALRISETLNILEVFEDRPADSIYQNLINSSADVIRIRAQSLKDI